MSNEPPVARPPLDGTPVSGWRGEEVLAVNPEQAASASDMDRALLRGLAWTAVAKWGSQLLSWASTLIVANILDPSDYGIVGMSVLVITLISLLNEFGVTTAIVTLRELQEDDLKRLNAFALVFSALCFLCGLALAIPIGHYFRSPVLPFVVVVQSTGFIVSALQSVPSARLQREMAFKSLAAVDVGRSVVASVAASLLAYFGARYWSLVGAELIAATTQTILLVRLRPTGFMWTNFRQVGGAIAFGSRTVVGRFSWYIYSNADFAIAGRVLGASALGAYSFAWTLVSLPIEKIAALLARVTPTILAASRNDPLALRRYVLGITESLALLTIPATVGIALTASDTLQLLFHGKWQMAVAPLQFLAACMALRSIMPVTTNALIAIQDIRFLMWQGVACAISFPVAFLIGASYGGIRGIAGAWLVAYPLSTIPLFWRASHKGLFTVREYLRSLAPSLEGSALMAAAVLFVRWRLLSWPAPSALVLRVFAEVATGVVMYACVLRFRYYSRVQAAIAFARSPKRPAVAA